MLDQCQFLWHIIWTCWWHIIWTMRLSWDRPSCLIWCATKLSQSASCIVWKKHIDKGSIQHVPIIMWKVRFVCTKVTQVIYTHVITCVYCMHKRSECTSATRCKCVKSGQNHNSDHPCINFAPLCLSMRPVDARDWSCHSFAWTKASQRGKSQA